MIKVFSRALGKIRVTNRVTTAFVLAPAIGLRFCSSTRHLPNGHRRPRTRVCRVAGAVQRPVCNHQQSELNGSDLLGYQHRTKSIDRSGSSCPSGAAERFIRMPMRWSDWHGVCPLHHDHRRDIGIRCRVSACHTCHGTSQCRV